MSVVWGMMAALMASSPVLGDQISLPAGVQHSPDKNAEIFSLVRLCEENIEKPSTIRAFLEGQGFAQSWTSKDGNQIRFSRNTVDVTFGTSISPVFEDGVAESLTNKVLFCRVSASLFSTKAYDTLESYVARQLGQEWHDDSGQRMMTIQDKYVLEISTVGSSYKTDLTLTYIIPSTTV